MSLVGKKAPWFKEVAIVDGQKIVPEFTLEKYAGRHDVVMFFYPMDFSMVCPTELIAFSKRKKDFEERNVKLIAVSCDTEQSHLAWLQIPVEYGGIKGVTYPIVSDKNKTMAKNYGVLTGDYYYDDDDMLRADSPTMVAFRGLFLIDRDGVVRHESINDITITRDVDDVLRVVDAFQYYREWGDVCPAGWHKGESTVKPTWGQMSSYLSGDKKEK